MKSATQSRPSTYDRPSKRYSSVSSAATGAAVILTKDTSVRRTRYHYYSTHERGLTKRAFFSVSENSVRPSAQTLFLCLFLRVFSCPSASQNFDTRLVQPCRHSRALVWFLMAAAESSDKKSYQQHAHGVRSDLYEKNVNAR